jgi:hypothetical protein
VGLSFRTILRCWFDWIVVRSLPANPGKQRNAIMVGVTRNWFIGIMMRFGTTDSIEKRRPSLWSLLLISHLDFEKQLSI